MQSPKYTVLKPQNRMPLIDFLAHHLAVSRRKAKQLCDDRMVFVNGQRIWMARHPLSTGDVVEVHQQVATSSQEPRKLKILYQDNEYLIVNKPAGILSNGRDSVEEWLQKQEQNEAIQAVHRLDKDTTGCLLFARSQQAFDAVIPLFKNHRITKVYHAIVEGKVSERTKEINTPIENQPARTRLQILSSRGLATHLKIAIDTGRTHQIRIHLQSIHHPILGEKVYAGHQDIPEEFRRIPRQMLHAFRLVFEQPLSGELIRATAPLPEDFSMVLRRLRLT
jgi:23S rRNA pseudouridine1911/1915/1917 synthase